MRELPISLATLPSTATAVKMATLSITPEVAQFIEEAVARGVAEGLAKLSLAPSSSEPQKPSGKAPKEKKARKPRDPDAKPNRWIDFTRDVRKILNESGHKLGVEATQFCSSLKAKNADLDSWTAEAILTEFTSWEKPEVSKQAAAGKNKGRKGSNATAESAVAASASESEKPEKPKKVLSPEHLAAMAEGRKKKAAEKKAAAGSPPASPEVKVSTPAPAPVAAAPAADSEWKKCTIKGKSYLWNPENNYCYYRETDGSQGDWAGIMNPQTRTIDTSIPEPVEGEEEGDDFVLED